METCAAGETNHPECKPVSTSSGNSLLQLGTAKLRSQRDASAEESDNHEEVLTAGSSIVNENTLPSGGYSLNAKGFAWRVYEGRQVLFQKSCRNLPGTTGQETPSLGHAMDITVDRHRVGEGTFAFTQSVNSPAPDTRRCWFYSMPCQITNATWTVNPRWNTYFLVRPTQAAHSGGTSDLGFSGHMETVSEYMATHPRGSSSEEPAVLLEVKSSFQRAAEATHRRWSAALLFVRMMGGRVITTTATSSSAAMVSIAALMCVVVITAYLFLQTPSGFAENEGKRYPVGDGNVYTSPHPAAARHPRPSADPRHGSRQFLPNSKLGLSMPPSAPGTAAQLPARGSAMGPQMLATPYTANMTPLSTSMTVPSRESPAPSSRYLPEPPNNFQAMSAAAATKGLCPGLVVPPNSECVLAIRSLADLKPSSGGLSPRQLTPSAQKLDILDLQGKPVMRAQIVCPWPQEQSFKNRPPVVSVSTLRPSDHREEQLTFCRAGGEGGGRRSMYIYDKDDVLFGCIKRDVTRPRYVLTSSRGGLQLLFEGDFLRHMVSVIKDNREMLAHAEPSGMTSEPSSHYYQVRVAAGVDVGLIISGLLSIDAMETM